MTAKGEPADSTAELPTLESVDALETVPGYALVRMLTETTLVRVYECRAERSGEIVVVKVLTKETAGDRNAVNRMLRENRVIAGLRNHPHIARVIDVGEAPAGPYVALEKLAGVDLRTRLNQGARLPVAQALLAVRDAARAVEAAAAVGVAHRDIKPSNLFLLEDTTVKLTDFGFAAPLSRLGGPEGVYGTPAFIAPELIKGGPADVRTDIYALGATLFQLVTARPLFEGSTPEVLAAHQKKPVPSIATMVPDAGIAVVDILYRLLHKDPARRPQTAGEVVKLLDEALQKARRGPATQAPAPSEPQWPTLSAPKPAVSQRREIAAAPSSSSQPVITAPASLPSSPFDPAATEAEPYLAQPTGVMGTLKQMSVVEIIQMLEIGKKSARIEVQTAPAEGPGLKGVVHVHDGQLVHCTVGAQEGEPALLTLCVQKEGFFRIHYDKEACDRNITRPTTFVLLEAMRQLDEASAPVASPSPAPASSSSAPPMPHPITAPARPRPGLAKPASPEGPASSWSEPPPVSRREPTHAGPKPVSGIGHPDRTADGLEGIGDGIELEGDTSLAAHDGPSVDDVTLRETPMQRGGFDAALRQAWRTAEPALSTALRASERGIKRAAQAVEPLRPRLARIHPKLGEIEPLAVIAVAVGVILAILVGMVSVARTPHAAPSAEAALATLVRGHANDVVASLAGADRTAAQSLVLGDAYAVLHDDDDALAQYQRAIPAGAVDPLALGFLISRLDGSDPDDEIDLLVLWPSRDVEDALAPLTLDVRSFRRANAVAALVERGALGRLNVEQTAMLDLLPREGSCTSRVAAMRALGAAGHSKGALETVARVGRANDTCFAAADADIVAAAYKAIKKRL